jgi:hypothetical protein
MKVFQLKKRRDGTILDESSQRFNIVKDNTPYVELSELIHHFCPSFFSISSSISIYIRCINSYKLKRASVADSRLEFKCHPGINFDSKKFVSSSPAYPAFSPPGFFAPLDFSPPRIFRPQRENVCYEDFSTPRIFRPSRIYIFTFRCNGLFLLALGLYFHLF